MISRILRQQGSPLGENSIQDSENVSKVGTALEQKALADSERPRGPVFGIASAADTFEEKTKIITDDKLAGEPSTPYPGEEWFWQKDDQGQLRLTAEHFDVDQFGQVNIKL